MYVHRFEIPTALCSLIETGVWPSEGTSAKTQETTPTLGPDAAHVLSLEDDQIALMTPPFHTIADEVRAGNLFWTRELSNVGEIDYDKAVIIADFGLGSDSPIILYYASDESPVVMYLKWSINGNSIQHSWVQTHSSFGHFAKEVGLVQCG